jgi:uncharacterized protein (TIGR03435 family)
MKYENRDSGYTFRNPAAENRIIPIMTPPSIFRAIHEQLGLKLESTKGPVQVLLIDHVEMPSEN